MPEPIRLGTSSDVPPPVIAYVEPSGIRDEPETPSESDPQDAGQ